MKWYGPGLLFAGKFFLNYRFCFTSSDQSVQIVFLHDSVLTGSVFLETCPFLLGCAVCWCVFMPTKRLHSMFLGFFCLSAILIDISPPSFLVYLGPLFFLFSEPDWALFFFKKWGLDIFSWNIGTFFYWSIVDLQCWVNVCCKADWFSYTCVFFQMLFHYGLSQDIE